LLPVAHAHVPPGPEHVSPEMVQSFEVQQVVLGMHWLFCAHGFCPAAHAQALPGLGHVSPAMVQSELVQQALMAMHRSSDVHGLRLGGQLSTHVPPEQAWFSVHTWPQVPQLFGSLFVLAQ
jgi:hypothetical protein